MHDNGAQRMRKGKLGQKMTGVLLAVLVAVGVLSTVGLVSTVNAVNPSSTNYEMTESSFNAGSGQSCSTEYCAQVTIGDAGSSGMGTTAAFQADNPSGDPLLEMIIESGESNLGVLSTTRTGTKTTVVKVNSYKSDGYMLQIIGDAPKYQGHTLATSTIADTSKVGVEQFGMNLVANNTPAVGADPMQSPDDDGTSFGLISFGTVMPGYEMQDRFKYENGDTFARSLTNSGRMDYTLSMIVNISSATPAGQYSSDFSILILPAY